MLLNPPQYTTVRMKHIGKTGRDNLGAAISMLALAVVSVALRLVVRIITRQWSPLSDGLLLLSLACMAVFAALLIQCMSTSRIIQGEERVVTDPMVTQILSRDPAQAPST